MVTAATNGDDHPCMRRPRTAGWPRQRAAMATPDRSDRQHGRQTLDGHRPAQAKGAGPERFLSQPFAAQPLFKLPKKWAAVQFRGRSLVAQPPYFDHPSFGESVLRPFRERGVGGNGIELRHDHVLHLKGEGRQSVLDEGGPHIAPALVAGIDAMRIIAFDIEIVQALRILRTAMSAANALELPRGATLQATQGLSAAVGRGFAAHASNSGLSPAHWAVRSMKLGHALCTRKPHDVGRNALDLGTNGQ